MPFTALNATGFASLEDSKSFTDAPIDGSISYEMQGGLVVSRKRFTRDPGRHIETGFTMMPQSDKALLDAFYASVAGGASAFYYVHPITGTSLLVRFVGEYKSTYHGMGTNYMWDIAPIKLRTV